MTLKQARNNMREYYVQGNSSSVSPENSSSVSSTYSSTISSFNSSASFDSNSTPSESSIESNNTTTMGSNCIGNLTKIPAEKAVLIFTCPAKSTSESTSLTTTDQTTESQTTTTGQTTESQITTESQTTTTTGQTIESQTTTTTSQTSTPVSTSAKCMTETLFAKNCWPDIISNRIVGGGPASEHQYPYQIGYAKGSTVVCGGSIITPTWIVTAAHCVYNYSTGELSSNVNIYYNTINRKQGPYIPASRIIIHPEYAVNSCPRYFVNDIALVELCEPLNFNLPGVKPVCFAKSPISYTGNFTATGWGDREEGAKNGSDALLKVVLDAITEQECTIQYNKLKGITVPPKTGSYICTYTRGKDTCQGDSGGPLVAEVSTGCWLLMGVTSYGRGCARNEVPGIYTRVSAYTDWICNTTKSC